MSTMPLFKSNRYNLLIDSPCRLEMVCSYCYCTCEYYYLCQSEAIGHCSV